MPQQDYGIYRISPNGTSVQPAKIRATELAHKSLGQQVTVYDLRNPAKAVFEMKQ